jgi:colanic acid/amylovoran biosynthesis glycosyltransferase
METIEQPEVPGRPRVVYVTASLPYGDDERFVVPEIEELERQGVEVVICPRGWLTPHVESDTRHLLGKTLEPRLISAAIVATALRELAQSPRRGARAIWQLRRSRSPRMLLKNLAIVPKGLWLARYARHNRVQHLHAHWAGTTATLALVASMVSGVPFSFTAHRWDIAEDNLLETKVRVAAFARAIDHLGADELARLSGSPEDAVVVIHMGVVSVANGSPRKWRELPTIAVPATFVEIKGHTYLLQAMSLLAERGVPARVELAGEGSERRAIEREIADRSLADRVLVRGFVPHDQLLKELAEGRYDMVVLPSIIPGPGEREGIPVALMEALAAGVPAIGTNTGGIPELLHSGAGLLVPDRDAKALADAIELLIRNPEERAAMIERGYERVRSEFSIEPICRDLAARFAAAGQPDGVSTELAERFRA